LSRISFENYGLKAKQSSSYLQIASRFEFMEESENFIIHDILEKLKLEKKDNIIDIGCGAGNITIPLNSFVSHTTCIDHRYCLDRLNSRLDKSKSFKLIPGNFIDLKIKKTFDKMLCYSVIHYLKDEKEMWDFILKAIYLLKPGGLALFGDLPNKSKKERFINTKFGKKIDSEYKKSLKNNNLNKTDFVNLSKDVELVDLNDESILRLVKKIRDEGFNAYLLDQPPQLSLSYTREDILVSKPLQ
jgi:2-polyprenyl-3-methyl-5-hydroxy-6-metoxy-1,4-benzoquinol methylase